MPLIKARLGSHCPQVTNAEGRPTLTLPTDWRGVQIEETVVPGDAECGPQYTGFPILSFFLNGEVKRWYRSGLKTRILDNSAPGFDIYGATYERDFGKWKGVTGTSLRIKLPPATIQTYLPEQTHCFDLQTTFATTDDTLRQSVICLANEIKSGFSNGLLFAEGLSLTILGWLAKHYATGQCPQKKVQTLSSRHSRRIVDYIECFLDSGLTIEKLAALVGISPGHFAVLFRATFQDTPHQYILRKRIDKAAQLLRSEQDYSILDVAMATGFSSQAHLTATFKRYLKQTPAHWKNCK